MQGYIFQRLLLLPLTLLAIIIVNFIIINLAPGEPVYLTQVSGGGEASRQSMATMGGPEDRYVQFRHFFGLNLPLIYNDWPTTQKRKVVRDLERVLSKDLTAKQYSELRIELADRAPFCLSLFLAIAKDPKFSYEVRKLAFGFFIRGAARFTEVNPKATHEIRKKNQEIAVDNLFLDRFRVNEATGMQQLDEQIKMIDDWYVLHQKSFDVPTEGPDYWKIAFFDTRLAKYVKRTLSLDFGVLRNDPNRTVMSEVVSRLKYSLILSVIPLVITFILCQIFGMYMAIYSNSFFDRSLDLLFLILWATPVFVMGPFFIEKLALHHNFPFTDHPFPIRGFSSADSIYDNLTSWQRITDIFRHITLPLLTIFYGSMAVQTRLFKAVYADCMRQDYVRTAKAKGVKPFALYVVHIGRNAAIPIITSVAGSLGVVLGGSVIIETIFEIHGFGKFFYDAIVNRDYNVMMFSTLVGSFLGLVGYLVADLLYMFLDPRVTLSEKV
jgi:peptide/nickel transport system permease protein